ncbi:ATP-grasp domain-containing protein [Microbispora sp. RL4-1S]|uniref:ATP-grasp domain-containing protein n=1 Tax=Microbispora oryzae TaxID=2806554 RepID=A0A940WGH8_9ACTN|nr:ATP-grasp domain-containing protein [Microbispora oryzae]MBP2702772.1 ATP-grasp domain-containing protein [Microbispora oryzae]
MQNFLSRMKKALTGSPDTPLVFLGNFEVEDQWARGEPGLPRTSFSAGAAIVNRMDEFALLLAGEGDHVVLKEAPDDDHLAHLEELGIALPEILTAARNDPGATVTRDALADPGLLRTLSGLAGAGALLSPHGTSEAEEELSAAARLPLVTPSAAVCKAVNSKIYSRRLADETGIRQATGWTAGTLAELADAVAAARSLLAAGRSVVAKDAFGVSGKGITVIDDERRLDRLHEMILRRARKSGDQRAALLVEEWVAKKADLNYQFTVYRDGSSHFDFVKEAITEGGVHKGHRIPADLTPAQVAELEETSRTLAKRLAADGFWGVVGVDAMVDPDDRLYPVIEINARNNMSTYQVRMQELFMAPGQVALARQYPLRLARRLPYARLRAALDDLLLAGPGGAGLLVNNFATVNAGAGDGPFDGRLYGLLLAPDRAALAALDREIAGRLHAETDRRPS